MKFTLPALALLSGALAASSSSAEPSVPTPGATCTGSPAYCAGSNTNIILRCTNGQIVAGNCNDNTGEPAQGALCNSFAANTATCSVLPASTESSSSASATYACNPAHSYPNGQSCISTAGTLSLVQATAAAPAATAATTYACNPAHSYPNGQSCISTAGTLSLVAATAAAPASTATGASSGQVSQIGDGQPQAPTGKPPIATGAADKARVAGLVMAVAGVVGAAVL